MASTKRKDNRGRNLKDGETQLPDGRYKFQYVDANGSRKAVYAWRLVATDRTPPGKRDDLSIREKEDAIAADVRDGIDGAKARKITLNDVFELCMSGKNLKQSTRTNFEYMYRRYVQDTLGKKPISSIKYSDVKRFYQDLLNGKGTFRTEGFKPNSLEVIHSILHPAFTLAVRDGIIRVNPSDGVMAEIKKSHAWEKPKRHALTIEEQTAFVDFISQSEIYSHWLPLFTCFLGTGCRAGELLGLCWEDCDFEAGTISINHNLIYRQQDNGRMEMHVTTPKTSAGCRTIPMLKEVRAALHAVRLQQFRDGIQSPTVDGYSNFVFLTQSGDPQTAHNCNRAIERIYKAYNEQETERAKAERREPMLIRHFSVHNLRHTFCTRMCESGVHVKIIQDIMGHADVQTTLGIYAETSEAMKKDAFNALEGKIKLA